MGRRRKSQQDSNNAGTAGLIGMGLVLWLAWYVISMIWLYVIPLLCFVLTLGLAYFSFKQTATARRNALFATAVLAVATVVFFNNRRAGLRLEHSIQVQVEAKRERIAREREAAETKRQALLDAQAAAREPKTVSFTAAQDSESGRVKIYDQNGQMVREFYLPNEVKLSPGKYKVISSINSFKPERIWIDVPKQTDIALVFTKPIARTASEIAANSSSTETFTSGQCWVNGYTRRSGKYVSGYYRRC
jgi:hypothetical protein